MRVLLTAAAIALAAGGARAQAAADDAARGHALRVAGRPAEAIAPLQAAARADPRDADVWLDLGLAYSATARFDDAEQALGEAARLAPDYADAQIALARLAYFREDLAEAERRLAPVLAAHPDNAEARELAGRIARARAARPRGWRLDAGYSRGRLSRGLPADSDVIVGLGRSLPQGRAVSARVERLRRFGLSDTYGELEFGAPRGYLVVGGASRPHFRPRWSARGGLNSPTRALGDDWTAQLGAELSWSRYPLGEVRALTPALTLAKGDALSFTARWINLIDERDDYRGGYALRALWQVAPRVRLSAGWADAPESSDGLTQPVRAASVGVALDLDSRTTVRLDAVHEDRRAYDRDELAAGLTRRF